MLSKMNVPEVSNSCIEALQGHFYLKGVNCEVLLHKV